MPNRVIVTNNSVRGVAFIRITKPKPNVAHFRMRCVRELCSESIAIPQPWLPSNRMCKWLNENPRRYFVEVFHEVRYPAAKKLIAAAVPASQTIESPPLSTTPLSSGARSVEDAGIGLAVISWLVVPALPPDVTLQTVKVTDALVTLLNVARLMIVTLFAAPVT